MRHATARFFEQGLVCFSQADPSGRKHNPPQHARLAQCRECGIGFEQGPRLDPAAHMPGSSQRERLTATEQSH